MDFNGKTQRRNIYGKRRTISLRLPVELHDKFMDKMVKTEQIANAYICMLIQNDLKKKGGKIMAINVYSGVMGSGKSYELVVSVIVPAIKAGRRVVTSVDGINEDEIFKYILKDKEADPSKLGTVVHVTNDEVQANGFFPDEDDPESPSVVKAGDMICIDEAWRFWSKDHKLPAIHMKFFRMHRHYVDEKTGVTCDVALIVQDIADLHPRIRAVVEMTTVARKLKVIGRPDRFSVTLFEGGRCIKTAKIDQFQRKYEKDVFVLYKSYDASAGGVEKVIDARQNVFASSKFKMNVLALVLLIGGGGYFVYKFFHKDFGTPAKSQTVKDGAQKPVSGEQALPVQSVPGAVPALRPDSDLRVAGEIYIGWSKYVVLADPDGRLRLLNAAHFVGEGMLTQGEVEGRRYTTFGGKLTTPTGVTK